MRSLILKIHFMKKRTIALLSFVSLVFMLACNNNKEKEKRISTKTRRRNGKKRRRNKERRKLNVTDTWSLQLREKIGR